MTWKSTFSSMHWAREDSKKCAAFPGESTQLRNFTRERLFREATEKYTAKINSWGLPWLFSDKDFIFQCKRGLFDPWSGNSQPKSQKIKPNQYCNKFDKHFKKWFTSKKKVLKNVKNRLFINPFYEVKK